ncbi:hypothetical protein TI04_07475 [Achromatium sp. WMS2]|nr:hypothetical protein TI04_07475 [Achromatium sp. WMS2]
MLKSRRIRSNTQDSGGSFDSLLDTVSNVVGILVVTLAVSQLSADRAIERVKSSTVRPNVQSSIRDLPTAKKLRQDLTAQYNKLTTNPVSSEQLTATEHAINSSQQALNRLKLANADRSNASELDNVILKINNDAEKNLQQAIDQLKSQQQLLQQELANIQEQTSTNSDVANKTANIRLPQPREVPSNSSRLSFYCQHDRLIFMGSKITLYSLSLRVFDFKVAQNNSIHLILRDLTAGETARDLTESTSLFQTTLDQHQPTGNYVYFYVWPKCFSTYLHARNIAEIRGYSVGWSVFSNSEVLALTSTSSSSTIRPQLD